MWLFHHLQKGLVHPAVVGKFRMESRRHNFTLAHQNGIAARRRQHFNFFSHSLDSWRADKYHLHGPARELGFSLTTRTLELPPIRVAADAYIQSAQACLAGAYYLFRQQDGARAGPQCRFGFYKVAKLAEEVLLLEKFEECGGFPPRDHHSVYIIKLLGLADIDHLRAQALKHPAVRFVVALNGKHSYGHNKILAADSADEYRLLEGPHSAIFMSRRKFKFWLNGE